MAASCLKFMFQSKNKSKNNQACFTKNIRSDHQSMLPLSVFRQDKINLALVKINPDRLYFHAAADAVFLFARMQFLALGDNLKTVNRNDGFEVIGTLGIALAY